MFTIYKHEMKTNLKSLLIWCLSVRGMGFICILLFSSVKESMVGMAESFASMGAFSNAFGMSQLSIATLPGFYATEVGTIHSLGGAMFAAIISATMLSKEEDGHTSEFLFSLPISRYKVICAKLGSIFTNIILFNMLAVGIYLFGIFILREEMPMKEFFLYHGMQIVMQLEIGTICFCFSAFMRKNKLGISLGIVLILYVYDLMARVVPDLSSYKVLSPFSYGNAADILSTGELSLTGILIGIILLVASVCVAYVVYGKRDLAS